jgi:hypothetical protein
LIFPTQQDRFYLGASPLGDRALQTGLGCLYVKVSGLARIAKGFLPFNFGLGGLDLGFILDLSDLVLKLFAF